MKIYICGLSVKAQIESSFCRFRFILLMMALKHTLHFLGIHTNTNANKISISMVSGSCVQISQGHKGIEKVVELYEKLNSNILKGNMYSIFYTFVYLRRLQETQTSYSINSFCGEIDQRYFNVQISCGLILLL